MQTLIVVILALLGSAGCASRAVTAAKAEKPVAVQVTNWPIRTFKIEGGCWIPEHPDRPRASEPYTDPTYGRAYVPRREYDELVENNRQLNMEVRGIRECLMKLRSTISGGAE